MIDSNRQILFELFDKSRTIKSSHALTKFPMESTKSMSQLATTQNKLSPSRCSFLLSYLKYNENSEMVISQ